MGWYKTGTVTVTNNSATVVGVGTDFVTNVSAGEAFIGPDGETYEVLSVGASNSLTLARPYRGVNASGQVYGIVPVRGYIRDLAIRAADILDSYQTVPAAASQSAADAAASAIAAANIAAGIRATSASSVTVGVGGKTFAIQTGKQFTAGSFVLITQDGGSAWMFGQVTSYAGTSLAVSVALSNGVGNVSAWNISIAGAAGPTGATGATGSQGATGATGPANTLSVGTVTTGAAGSSASASVTGSAPNQTLNLVIPKGDKGDTGAQGPQGIQGPAGTGAVTSVAGKSGVVTLVKADVGLSNVDNTADATKAVLTATKLATARTIGTKSFDGSANISLDIADITGLSTALGGKEPALTLSTTNTNKTLAENELCIVNASPIALTPPTATANARFGVIIPAAHAGVFLVGTGTTIMGVSNEPIFNLDVLTGQSPVTYIFRYNATTGWTLE